MTDEIPRFDELTLTEQKMVAIIRNTRGIEAARELADDFVRINQTYEYKASEIVPIPAKCQKCGRNWVGRDAIRAPSLENCRCFYCHGQLIPHPKYPRVIDAKTAREGLFFNVPDELVAAAGRVP